MVGRTGMRLHITSGDHLKFVVEEDRELYLEPESAEQLEPKIR